MNSKLIKATLAGTAALAVAAGGSTFAAWSDIQVQSMDAGAGILKLDLSSFNTVGQDGNVTPFQLTPGMRKTQDYFLSSADSGNTPDGALTLTYKNVVNSEDGATCTTNSEAIAEGSPVDEQGEPTNAAVCGTLGELGDQVRVDINRAAPVDGSCAAAVFTYDAAGVVANFKTLSELDALADKSLVIDTLSAGEAVCLRVEMYLTDSATNSIQGDQVGFDWQFDLTQVL
jgi:hypothetical protein